MFRKITTFPATLSEKVTRARQFLRSPRSERGEESASVAAITGLVLLIILVIMAIFRNALIATFERIAGLLSF
ncbi:MAG TPA: hypothetical protein VN363_08770 [Anaerolineales bacterium]|nr:hypothetical protein [Anaerolineales bacterium]